MYCPVLARTTRKFKLRHYPFSACIDMELRRRVSFSGCSVFDARSIFVLDECLTVVSAVDSIGCVSSDGCAVLFRPLTVAAAVSIEE
jgi:hypothetical protein